MSRSWRKNRLAGLTGAALLSVAWTVPAELLDEAYACTGETSRLERLACYDALFQADERLRFTTELPALWHAIEAHESRREADDIGLLVSEAHGDVLLSAPALGAVPPRPLLVMACEMSITHVQLHLPQALDVPRVKLTLWAGGRGLEQAWRVRDAGRVLSGGRGLPAIDTLRQLLDADELVLGSEHASLDGLRFDTTELRQRIQPLRDACRW